MSQNYINSAKKISENTLNLNIVVAVGKDPLKAFSYIPTFGIVSQT